MRAELQHLEPRRLLAFGDFDPTFGNAAGSLLYMRTDILQHVNSSQNFGDVLPLSDGRIAAVGDLGITMLKHNGAVDRSFGTAGTALFPNRNDFLNAPANSMLRGSDGTFFLIASVDDEKSEIVRYSANGQLDTSYGSSGIVMADVQFFHWSAVDSHGRLYLENIVPNEYTDVNGTVQQLEIRRLTSTGQLDSTFANGGIFLFNLPDPPQQPDPGMYPSDDIRGLSIDSQDRLLITGVSAWNLLGTDINENSFANPQEQFAYVARFNNNGTLDTSFGANGVNSVARHSVPNVLITDSATFFRDNNTVLLATQSGDTDISLIDLDLSTGSSTTEPITGPDFGTGVGAIQPLADGRLLLTARGGYIAVATQSNDGSWTRSVALGLEPLVPGASDSGNDASDVHVDADGKILVVGGARFFNPNNPDPNNGVGERDTVLARLVPGSVNDPVMNRFANVAAESFAGSGEINLATTDATTGGLTLHRRDSTNRWHAPVIIDPSSDQFTDITKVLPDRLGLGYKIAYFDQTSGNLKFAQNDSADPAIDGGWTTETVDHRGVIGLNPSLYQDLQYRTWISYYDQTHGDLMLARRANKRWVIERVDRGGPSGEDVGRLSSVLQTGDGRWYIAYTGVNGEIRLATRQGTRGHWDIHTIAHANGQISDLHLDIDDQFIPNVLYVTYHDSGGDAIKLTAHAILRDANAGSSKTIHLVDGLGGTNLDESFGFPFSGEFTLTWWNESSNEIYQATSIVENETPGPFNVMTQFTEQPTVIYHNGSLLGGSEFAVFAVRDDASGDVVVVDQ